MGPTIQENTEHRHTDLFSNHKTLIHKKQKYALKLSNNSALRKFIQALQEFIISYVMVAIDKYVALWVLHWQTAQRVDKQCNAHKVELLCWAVKQNAIHWLTSQSAFDEEDYSAYVT